MGLENKYDDTFVCHLYCRKTENLSGESISMVHLAFGVLDTSVTDALFQTGDR